MSIRHTGTAKHVLPMGDPMDASIIQALRADLKEEQKRVEMLTVALERIIELDEHTDLDIAQCIAREALE